MCVNVITTSTKEDGFAKLSHSVAIPHTFDAMVFEDLGNIVATRETFSLPPLCLLSYKSQCTIPSLVSDFISVILQVTMYKFILGF